MLIQPPPEESAVAKAEVSRVVLDLAARGALEAPGLLRFSPDPKDITFIADHRFGLLGLEALSQPKVEEVRLTPVGWRFAVSANGEVIAATEAHAGPGGGFNYGGLNVGLLVSGFADARENAKEFALTVKRDLEARLLLILPLNLAALWAAELGSAGDRFGPHDFLIPIAPTVNDLPALKPVSPDVYLTIVRHLARDTPANSAQGG